MEQVSHSWNASDPQCSAGHLPGDGHHRHGIGLGPHDAGDQVGGPRPGCCQADADLAGDTGVAVGGVGCGLLVPYQDVAELRIAPEGVIEGQDCPAGVAEHHVKPLPGGAFRT